MLSLFEVFNVERLNEWYEFTFCSHTVTFVALKFKCFQVLTRPFSSDARRSHYTVR